MKLMVSDSQTLLSTRINQHDFCTGGKTPISSVIGYFSIGQCSLQDAVCGCKLFIDVMMLLYQGHTAPPMGHLLCNCVILHFLTPIS